MTLQQWHPGTLLETSGYFWKTGTLHAGVKLDVFTVIGEDKLSAEDIAARAGADVDAMTRLLDALSAMALTEKESGLYANTGAAAKYLSKNSPDYIGHMIMHHHYLVDYWRRLDESVKTGKPVQEPEPGDDETRKNDAEREAFLMGMFNIASLAAPQIAAAVDLEGKRRMLDMGGGPGTYAIHFCRKHPELRATVYDLPTTRPFAEKTIERFGMTDRIGFEDGNYLDQELPVGYDVVWMSHILHGEGYDACREMIRKAWRAMEEGGIIIIHEFILDETRTQPLFPALFSLNMLVGTEDGRSYTEHEIAGMLKDAGFRDIKRLSFTGPTQSGLMTALK
jgi:predicted O-methyltransferase YrrM